MPTFNVTEVFGSRLGLSTQAVARTRAQAVSARTFVPADELEFVDDGTCAAANGEYTARYSTPNGRQFLVWEIPAKPMVAGSPVAMNAY